MKGNRFFNLIVCLIWLEIVSGQDIFYVGHSLVNHDIPWMVNEIALSKGFTGQKFKEQIINGAPLRYNWDNIGEQGVSFRKDYDPSFNTLVITEAIPIDAHIMWNQTHEYAFKFCHQAENVNSNSQCYIYETWHCINSGTKGVCGIDDGDGVL